jgi:arsenate reductase-like glutaredoxin family protein
LESLTPQEWKDTHADNDLFFKTPQQLLDIMVTLEEQNMFLIRHCQEAEEAFERYRGKFNALLGARDGSITEMIDERARVQAMLSAREAENELYKTTGEFRHGNELNEGEMIELQTGILTFHQLLGFDAASSNDTPTMLRRIEGKMEEMTYKLSLVDTGRLKELAQLKEIERRNNERAEKNARDKKDQEEKTQKAIQLAMMPIKKRIGRPLIERMMPVKEQSREKREEALRKKLAREEADSDLLFGVIWD